MKVNAQPKKSTNAADTEAKAGLLNFITENNGRYYEVGIQMKFPHYSAEYLRKLLEQLENEHKIANNAGYSPYRVVRQ